MKLLKSKIFLPITAAALLTGYGLSEWVLPNYMLPMEETQSGVTLPAQFVWGSEEEYLQKFYRRSPSGNYLAGQLARREKDWANANDYMDQILREDPNNIDLQKNMMVLTMEAGYGNRAVTLAKSVLSAEEENMLAILFVMVDDLSQENYIEAKELLDQINTSNPASFVVPVLKLWIGAAKGNLTFEEMDDNSFYLYHLLLAAKYLSSTPQAVNFVEENIEKIDLDFRDVEKIADLLTVTGGKDVALKLYESLSKHPYFGDKVQDKIAKIEAEEDIEDSISIPDIKNPKQGAAQVFMDMASIMFREGSDDSATIFAQMALYLDENLSDARFIIARVLRNSDRYEDAANQLKKIDKNNRLYRKAQKMLSDIYLEKERTEDSIAILEGLYEAYDDVDALIRVGDVYRYDEEYDKAIKVYTQALKYIENSEEKNIKDFWHLLYVRGMAYERVKKYKKSEEDLEAALEFQPNHPHLLNYLGYSWVDQGRNLEKSLKMLQKAVSLVPDDGYVIDSLGWAYYKMGDMNLAINYLEDAVEILPYDATINDHLGDAYWQTGRRLEARFQWQRAYNYSEENEEELKLKIEAKLQNGLEAVINYADGYETETVSSESGAQAL